MSSSSPVSSNAASRLREVIRTDPLDDSGRTSCGSLAADSSQEPSLHLHTARQIGEYLQVVRVIYYHHPSAIRLVAQPRANDLQNIDFGIIPPGDPGRFSNPSISLLDPCFAARVDPEYPRLGCTVSQLVGVLDRQL